MNRRDLRARIAKSAAISIGPTLLAVALCAGAAPPSYTAIRLGNLGGAASYGRAINSDGQVVGWATKPGASGRTDGHAWLFTGSTTVALGTFGGEQSVASDINDQGDIVGTFSGGNSSGGFVLSNGVVRELPVFPNSINASGAIAGRYEDSGGMSHAVLLSNEAVTDLGSFGGRYVEPTSVNASGQVIGYADIGGGDTRAFLYSGGTLINLGTLDGPRSSASDINARGDVVGAAEVIVHGPFFDFTPSRAFLYTSGRMVNLGTIGGFDPGPLGYESSSAAAINDGGQIVGTSTIPVVSLAANADRAFLYIEGVMHDLNTLVVSGLDGLTLTNGVDINLKGQIVALACVQPSLYCQTFRLDPSTPPGKARAVEYYHAAFDHYFMTAIGDEIAKLDSGLFAGWSRTSGGFDVDVDAQPGTSPVCRFFSASFAPKSSHFYTPDLTECETVKRNPAWQFEGVVFHVAKPDANGACPAGKLQVYRLYNNGMDGAPNHRYTTSTITRSEMIGKGWIPEGYGFQGVAMCV